MSDIVRHVISKSATKKKGFLTEMVVYKTFVGKVKGNLKYRSRTAHERIQG